MTFIRSTQEIAIALYDVDPTGIRVTQQFVSCGYTPETPVVRVTQQYINVLYTDARGLLETLIQTSVGVVATLTLAAQDSLTVDLTATATIAANITLPGLSAEIQASAEAQAEVTGIWQFTTGITVAAHITASMANLRWLTSTIVASGDISVEIRENIEYLAAEITVAGDISAAELDVPWHAGNTLDLQQNAAPTLVLERSVADTLVFSHDVSLIFGYRGAPTSSVLNLTHAVTVTRLLPTKTASNVLNLTHSLAAAREAESYLILTQEVIGTITFLEGLASNTLNLTDSVTTEGSIYGRSLTGLLGLTHAAGINLITDLTAQSTILFHQNAYAAALESKKYVLLQAPFELIQTSMVLPNPLLDDGENLVSNLLVQRSMDGTARAYVQTSKSRRLKYTFTMSRMKALEAEAFFDAYNGANIKLLNWKGEIWKVKLITNPVDFVMTRRYGSEGDRTDVNIELEGELIHG